MADMSPLDAFFFCLHRYKLVELAFYLTMGFFPASVVTSMVTWQSNNIVTSQLKEDNFVWSITVLGSVSDRVLHADGKGSAAPWRFL